MAKYDNKARADNNRKYGGGEVQGNLAYDFEYLPSYEIPAPEPVPEPAPRPKRKAAARGRQALSPGAILGGAAAAVLTVFMLMAYIQLTAVSDEVVKLQRRVNTLREEETRLIITYESVVNLTEIEDYAINVLGMQQPRGDQVYYLSGAVPDTAVIVKSGRDGDKGYFAALLANVAEYFK